MRKYVGPFIFLLSLFCFVLSHSSFAAVSPITFSDKVKKCIEQPKQGTSPNYYFRCDSYLTDISTCLTDIVGQDTTWTCQETLPDGTIIENKNNLNMCSTNFSAQICDTAPSILTGQCKTTCKGEPYRDATSGQTVDPVTAYEKSFNDIFQNKYKFQHKETTTPTPAPIDKSVVSQDTCLNQVLPTNTCSTNMKALFNCYRTKENENSGMWSCTAETGEELNQYMCEESFVKRIKTKLISTIGDACLGNYGSTSDGLYFVSYDGLKKLFYDKRSDRKYVTPTPGVVDKWLYNDLIQRPSDTPLDTAKTLFNCGFANAGDDEAEKRVCCNQKLDELDSTVDGGEYAESSDQGWFNPFKKFTVNNLLEDVSGKVKSQIVDSATGLNTVAQEDSEKPLLPLCFIGEPSVDTTKNSCVCEYSKSTQMCSYITGNSDVADACVECLKGNSNPNNSKKFYTAIGCIDTSPAGIIQEVFSRGIGIAGLVALGCIVYSAFMMQVSQGNPEQIQKAQEQITSCITGLILIILSVFILRVIGVDILRIPGFSS